jgi:N6-L-threonylcarbamoyladenine synthase
LKQKVTTILGIESSCDDTSAAVVRQTTVLSNVVARQDIHAQYGGVVPELASRSHQKNIIPVVDVALKNAGVSKADLDAVAFTRGPGLLGSLIVGTSFAKSFSLAMGIPMIEVNHMVGHVLAHFIDDTGTRKPAFPFLCLTVSGGHTQLVLVEDYLKMRIIGTTLDDAAGEAFDKAAKMLGFPYPGGPMIDTFAQKGNPEKFNFSKPLIDGLDYSFSGLKTSILYFLQKMSKTDEKFVERNLHDLCASIQRTIIEILMAKVKKAAEQFGIQDIALAGGVSANSSLREAMKNWGKACGKNIYIPPFEYCTDNAAMIAITGKYLFEKGITSSQEVAATARYEVNNSRYLIDH